MARIIRLSRWLLTLLNNLATIAWENYRARFNHAFGAEPENFSEGGVCAMAVRP
jgi:hypothetical protein